MHRIVVMYVKGALSHNWYVYSIVRSMGGLVNNLFIVDLLEEHLLALRYPS